MLKLRRDSFLFLIAAVILAIAAYLFFKSSFRLVESNPFFQEFLSAMIGATITAMITAALLNKQSEIELMKEENVKFLELKVAIYTQLLDHIESFLLTEHVTDRDIIKLRILHQKISFVAGVPVLEAFGEFSQSLSRIVSDRKLVTDEIDELLRNLGNVSIGIRFDLLESMNAAVVLERSEAVAQIIENTQYLEIRRSAS